MADIRVEQKNGKGWIWWLVALILVALLVWWLLGRNDELDGVASASDSTAVPAAMVPDVSNDGDVDGYLGWVSGIDTANTTANVTAGDLSHEYTATGVRQLAGAIGAITRGDSLANAGLEEQVSALNTLADRMQTEPESLKHADLAHAAFTSAAALLQDVQQRRFPNAEALVANTRAAADAVSKDRPLLEQRAQVNRFFSSAAEAVRAMRNAT